MESGQDETDSDANSGHVGGLQPLPAEVYHAMKSNNIELLEDLLSKQNLDLVAALDNEKKLTVLHQAAVTSKSGILPIVLAALQRTGMAGDALRSRDCHGSTPLAYAAENQRFFDNFSALLKSCDEMTPEVIQWKDDNGNNLLHVAVGCRCVPALRALVARDDMQRALLEENKRGSTPLQAAKMQMQVNQTQLQMERVQFDQMAARMKWDSFTRQIQERSRFSHRLETIQALQEVIASLEHPTMEAKAAAAAHAAAEAIKQKEATRRREVRDNCVELLDKGDWFNLLSLIRSKDCIQQMTALEMIHSASKEGRLDESSIPIISNDDFTALQAFVVGGDDACRLHVISFLVLCCLEKENQTSLTKQGTIMSGLLSLVRSLNLEIQLLCLKVVHTLAINDNFCEKSCWIQPLLLLKFYSSSTRLRRSAGDILTCLCDESSIDPGSWTVEDVAVWLDGKEELQDRSLYSKQFVESGIDGLHLLELTHEDMKGLGVKHFSDRRKIATYVDDLRRLNAPSVVGKKDIFLSYAHVNIAFARKMKNALTDAGYSVWIDEAGIRAGAKWRDAIASGVENCRAFVFVMTPRSASSEYCQDELGLAEEHRKPIFNVIIEDVPMSLMDPGLKLIISRRQWTFFTDDNKFAQSFETLVTGIRLVIGAGRLRDNSDGEEIPPDDDTTTVVSHNKILGDQIPVVAGSHKLMTAKDIMAEGELKLAARVGELEVRVNQLESELERLQGLDKQVEELKQLFRT